MPRELRIITPAIVRNVPATGGKRYGPTYGDLIQFLAHKHHLAPESMRAIVADTFQYIRAEVLLWGAHFPVLNFGTFHRLVTAMNRNPSLFGEPVERSYLRFRQPASSVAQATIRDDNEELVDPTDEELERFYQSPE
jgi:nucleoid DNA-binding protein